MDSAASPLVAALEVRASAAWAISSAGPACPMTWEMISETPWAPLRTVRLSTYLNDSAAARTISGSCSAICWPMTASASFSSASARLAIDSASARPLARIDAPSASPLALVASPSAMPRAVVMRASELPICSICLALAAAASSTSRAWASAIEMRATRSASAWTCFS